MINVFKIKKYSVLLLCPLITTILFLIGYKIYNFVWGLLFLGAGLLLSVVLGIVLLKNPFSEMLEGKGILVFNMDSTGIIQPFIVSVNSPYIEGVFQKRKISDVFDRAAVFGMSAPKKAAKIIETSKEGIKIDLSEKEYNQARFQFSNYPVLLWNNQIKSVVTKDFLAEKEKTSFAEHGILYLNRKVEDLNHHIRDFGRYVVELTKPQQSFFQTTFGKIVLIAGLILLFALFAPSVYNVVAKFIGTGGTAIKTANPTISMP